MFDPTQNAKFPNGQTHANQESGMNNEKKKKQTNKDLETNVQQTYNDGCASTTIHNQHPFNGSTGCRWNVTNTLGPPYFRDKE